MEIEEKTYYTMLNAKIARILFIGVSKDREKNNDTSREYEFETSLTCKKGRKKINVKIRGLLTFLNEDIKLTFFDLCVFNAYCSLLVEREKTSGELITAHQILERLTGKNNESHASSKAIKNVVDSIKK